MGYRNGEGYIDPTAGDAINGVAVLSEMEVAL